MVHVGEQFAGCVAGCGAVVLAVSGGSDSMALMVLFAEWNAARERPLPPDRIRVVTVDHGLRAEAAQEARGVATAAARLGLMHETVRWDGPKPDTGLMEAARAARYRLLHHVAERNWPAQSVAVLTGHTAEDDVETFLMNLARGSGLDGLTGMPARRPLDRLSPHVWLMRPLLRQRRATLRRELETRGIGWIEDPSNDIDTFERVRVRKALDASGAGRDVVEGVAASMARLREASDALAAQIATLTPALTAIDGAGLVRGLRWSALVEQPSFIGKQILAQTLTDFGGQGRGPSLKKLDAFWAAHIGVEQPRTPFQATLGGCLIRGVCRRTGADDRPNNIDNHDDNHNDDDVLEICREPERMAFPTIDIKPGEVALWDHRFAVSVASDHGHTVRVAPRDAAFWDRVIAGASGCVIAAAPVMTCQLAKRALLTLPVAADVGPAGAGCRDHSEAIVAWPPPFDAASRSAAPVRIEWLGGA